MARVSTYVNFLGNTEEAFEFYRSVFGTEYIGTIARMGDVPSNPDVPPLSDAEQRMVMHVELPILGGHVLMGTDMIESMGHQLRIGNNTTIMLEPDTRAEADRLYLALSAGGSEATGMMDMPWNAYWGVCLDQFGIRWMVNVNDPQ
jgi:PhnB protein